MSQSLYISVNGQEGATLAADDRGLAFGDGVFETLLLWNGQSPFADWHLERLTRGLCLLSIQHDQAVIKAELDACLRWACAQQLDSGIVKLTVTRGRGRGYAPTPKSEPTVVVGLFPLTQTRTEIKTTGLDLTICQQRISYQPNLLGIKHLNRLENVLASIELQSKNYQEGLLLDDQGNVAEALSRNVFIAEGGSLLTPDLRRGGIQGVMRRMIIDRIGPDLSIPVEETQLSVARVLAADEAFLCNSITGIWPVNAIDEKQLVVGSITRQLQAAVNQVCGAY